MTKIFEKPTIIPKHEFILLKAAAYRAATVLFKMNSTFNFQRLSRQFHINIFL